MILHLAACDQAVKSDPREIGKARIAAVKAKRILNSCASGRAYERLKYLAFNEAIKIRNSDPRNLEKLATYSFIRMENPRVKSRDDALDVTVCQGRFILYVPPGAERGFNGRRILEANVEYTAQQAADGSGLIYQMAGADPIIYKLAAFDLRGHKYVPTAEEVLFAEAGTRTGDPFASVPKELPSAPSAAAPVQAASTPPAAAAPAVQKVALASAAAQQKSATPPLPSATKPAPAPRAGLAPHMASAPAGAAVKQAVLRAPGKRPPVTLAAAPLSRPKAAPGVDAARSTRSQRAAQPASGVRDKQATAAERAAVARPPAKAAAASERLRLARAKPTPSTPAKRASVAGKPAPVRLATKATEPASAPRTRIAARAEKPLSAVPARKPTPVQARPAPAPVKPSALASLSAMLRKLEDKPAPAPALRQATSARAAASQKPASSAKPNQLAAARPSLSARLLELDEKPRAAAPAKPRASTPVSPPQQQASRSAPPPAAARPQRTIVVTGTPRSDNPGGNSRLASLERSADRLYYSALDRADGMARYELQRSRRRFSNYLSGCRTESCLANAYVDRMAEIRDIVSR